MRKVWNTLVVLGVLLCMVISLGVAADAAEAEGDAAIFAVSGTQLAPENIDAMKAEYPDCLVVDVDGLDEGQSATGYNVVYTESDPGVMTDYACVWPGSAQMFYVGAQSRLVVLVGVGEASTADEVAAAVSAYLGDEPCVIAVGPAAAAGIAAGCADVDMFMTTGLDSSAAAGDMPVVNVGAEEETPVSLVKWNEDGAATGEAVAVPQPAAGTEAAPAEQTDDAAADPGLEDQPSVDPAGENDPAVEDQPSVEEQPDAQGESEVEYCKIIYDGNGRDSGSVPDVLDFIAGSTHFLSQNGYTREGYEFAGWKIDDGDTIYQPGDEVVIDHDVTVYAQWTEVTAGEPAAEDDMEPTEQDSAGAETVTYTVTYKAGEGAGDDIAFQFNETDSKEILLPDGSAFTPPEGKKFSGWMIEGTEEIWEANVSYTVSADVTFVARYSTVYTVTYDFGESATPGYSDQVFEGESYGLAGEAVVEVPEGKTFGGWLVNGELKQPGEEINITDNVTVTAQWNETEPETTPVTEITVTYKAGIEGIDDYIVTAQANSTVTLPECPFTLPDGQVFLGWKQMAEGDESAPAAADGEDVLVPGTEVDTAESNMVFAAVTETRIQVTVTYLPGDGSDASVQDTTEFFKSGEAVEYTLVAQPEEFSTPDGKTFGGWQLGDSIYQAGAVVALKEDVTVTAVWNDIEKEKVDPAADANPLSYTQQSEAEVEMSFSAEIDAVSVDSTALTLDSEYSVTEDGGTSTIRFDNAYLDGLSVGEHTVNVTFLSTDTIDYTPNTRTLTIEAAPVETTTAPTPNDVSSIKQNWDRSQNLTIDFSQYGRGNPVKLELLRAYEKDGNGDYKKDENGNYIPVWMELTKDKDYSVSGASMTVYPSLLGSWANQQYGFRVTFDGAGTDKGTNTMLLYLNVTGTVPVSTATAAPSGGSAGYVTGENVNLRSAASTDSKVLGTFAKGTKLTIHNIANGWAYVTVNGITGYMSANYVSYETAATATATPNGATSPATGDTNNVTLYIVLLVVLIIVLAVVLIVVMKRRKK